jgi:hypothetical protein
MPVLKLLIAMQAAVATPPQDTLIVEVLVQPGNEQVVVLAEASGDSALALPGGSVGRLLGLTLPPVVTLAELRERVGPGVVVTWQPARLRLVIHDTYGALPTTRRRLDELRAQSRAQPADLRGPLGLAMAFLRDDTGANQLDVGYVLARAAAFVSRSSEAGLQWNVSAAPLSRLWLNYQDMEGPDRRYYVDARLAVGRGFVALSYRGDGELGANGAVTLGPLAGFADPFNDRYVVTMRGMIDAQFAREGERSLMRVSYGAVDPSAFSVPMVRRR